MPFLSCQIIYVIHILSINNLLSGITGLGSVTFAVDRWGECLHGTFGNGSVDQQSITEKMCRQQHCSLWNNKLSVSYSHKNIILTPRVTSLIDKNEKKLQVVTWNLYCKQATCGGDVPLMV